jgi:DNA-binding transcriptional LysR family regulator
MTDLNAMIIFAKVVEAKSFSETARRLGMPISTVSRRVAELEDQLGVRLLDRSTRNLRLTDLGTEVLEQATRSVEINDAVESIVSNKLANVTGTLRLSAPQNISDTMLTPLVTAFQASYPNVRVHILIAERFVDHIADGVDIVFRLGALKDSSLVARKILTYRHQLVASPDYLKGREAPEMPQDLLRHRLLSFSYSDLDVISAVLLITGPQLGHRLMSQKGQHQTSCRLPSALRSNVKDPILRRANMRNSLGVTPAERSDGDQHRKAEIHSSFGAALTNATGDI